MKKLITTALLFAGLTINAQDFSSKYFTVDTTIENGIDYVPHFEALFVDQETKKDSIVVYPHICLYKDKGFVIEGFFFVFLNDNQKINKVYFNFSKKEMKLVDLKSYTYPQSNKVHFLSCKKNVNHELFIDEINKIEFNDKTYVPENNSDMYFVYMLGSLTNLKSNWLK